MSDIEALKHDKVSAAVKCVGLLDALIQNPLLSSGLLELAKQYVSEYMTAETALTIALDERCKANEARSGVKL